MRTNKPPSWEIHKAEKFAYLYHICQTEVKDRREVQKGESHFQVQYMRIAPLKSTAEKATSTLILHYYIPGI